MKFFFADNCDAVDPNYDFVQDQSAIGRNRNDDQYAHEVLDEPPYDGILVSRAIISNAEGRSERYSQTQRHRIFREGIRSVLRYPKANWEGDPLSFPLMGDCGSFSYIEESTPPFTAEQMLDFYESCQFTYGVSPDHIISEFNPGWDDSRRTPERILERSEFSLRSAKTFLALCRERKSKVLPIGCVQSWSARSAARHSVKLVEAGYDYIGLGGVASRRTQEILDIISEVRSCIPSEIRIHIFGFNRIDHLERFQGLNITSLDSTSPMIKSFKDERHNYLWTGGGGHYLALRVPPKDEANVKRRIHSGDLDGDSVERCEQECLTTLREGADSEASADKVEAYASMLGNPTCHREAYLRALTDRPWVQCPCRVCEDIGIEVMLHRGLNRHKRRGFHNLYVFYEKLKQVRMSTRLAFPCVQTRQSAKRLIFSFVADGKDVSKFASVSRVKRTEDGELLGYQRPEIDDHVNDIKAYLEKDDAILPNALVVAFNQPLKFEELSRVNDKSSLGTLSVPIDANQRAGWIVDGQQRSAALRRMKRSGFPVPIIAFQSQNVDEEREQFVLVNTTRPLPKSLVYELLPSIDDRVPPKLLKRQKAYRVLERLNLDHRSPFHQRIRTITSRHIPEANIKDVSVLKMIENSLESGILSKHPEALSWQIKVLKNFWMAVKSTYPEAWELPPRQSRLTHGVGIVSLGFLMDTIAYRVSTEWKNPPEHIYRQELAKLGELPWFDGAWDLAPGLSLPWNEVQNTSRHIDLVTNFLVRRYRRAMATS